MLSHLGNWVLVHRPSLQLVSTRATCGVVGIYLLCFARAYRPWARKQEKPSSGIKSTVVITDIAAGVDSSELSPPSPPVPKRRLRSFKDSSLMAMWLTLVIVCGTAWCWTIWQSVWEVRRGDPGRWKDAVAHLAFYATVTFLLLLLTFFLEGLEIAAAESADKDAGQFDRDAARQFRTILNMNGFFYETREWTIICLLVGATLMVDRSAYYLPFFADKISSGSHSYYIVRIIITVVLTTCPFVWLAQSPGKFVARKNSEAFLRSPGTKMALWLLRKVSWAVEKSGLAHPSRAGEDFALRMMKECQTDRSLKPSEYRFFADSIKSYGYGVLLAEDRMTIFPDGSCDVAYKALSYLGKSRDGIPREISFEEGFEGMVVKQGDSEQIISITDGLERASPQVWAFDVPPITEKVTDQLITDWQSLFDSPSPAEWINTGSDYSSKCHKISTERWMEKYRLRSPNVATRPSTDLSGVDQIGSAADRQAFVEQLVQTGKIPSPTRPLHHLNISLDFRGKHPRHEGRAMLVLWRFTVRMNKGTLILPTQVNKQVPNDYFKRYHYPSLRSTFVIKLPTSFFVRDNLEYEVTYEGVRHDQERVKFKQLQEMDQVLTENDSVLTVHVNSPLAASIYKVTWYTDMTTTPL